MATIFHRTGQFRSDHDAGRFVDADSTLLLSAGSFFDDEIAHLERANMVTGPERC
ncbi:hypothetical protein [Mycobacterium sp.]|uniref:hypothetical protein n=1 Tax=Mycobacterium sp. TaxID=1785 RepID=UPI0031DED847